MLEFSKRFGCKLVDILKEDEMISSADIAGPDLLTLDFTKNSGLN